MSKLICIISHQHLSRNPRVLKEGIALEKSGFNVTILTSIYSKKLLKEDLTLLEGTKINYAFFNNLTKKNVISYKNRAFNKIGRWFNRIGLENKWALGYAPTNCFKIAKKINADLFICHQELPTYIGTLLLKQNKKVGFDFEDWYSKDLQIEDRKFLPHQLLEITEYKALNHGHFTYTTSKPMAKEMALKYSSEEPEVVYNTFSKYKPTTCNNDKIIRLIWISQTIGPGRGLEDILYCLSEINHLNFELNLRGSVSTWYKKRLISSLTNGKHKINFLPLIPNTEIQSDLAKYDIGLALELSEPLSRDLTITNKIFHYLSVGLPVIASATAGQCSLADDFNQAILYFYSREELKQVLSNIQKDIFNKQRPIILNIYKEKYDWKIMESKLQKLVTDCIH